MSSVITVISSVITVMSSVISVMSSAISVMLLTNRSSLPWKLELLLGSCSDPMCVLGSV